MLNKVKQSKQQGFTIIEVMIVLAIAGLIMVVVFMAVPALQRSSRNNALSTSASNVLSAVSDYVSDNGGQLPVATIPVNGVPTNGSVGIGGTSGAGNLASAKVEAGVKAVQINGTAPTAVAANIGTIQVVTGPSAVCNATATDIGGAGSARSYAVIYIAEGGSGPIKKCMGN